MVSRERASVHKDSTNPHFKSSYADLEAVISASRPILSKHGFCVIQRLISVDGNAFMMSELCYENGEVLTSSMPIPSTLTNPQHIGSYITYMRRYSYCTLVGIITTDDDGNAAAQRSQSNSALTPKQKQYILGLMDKSSVKIDEVLRPFKVSSIDELSIEQAKDVVSSLQN